MVGQPWLEGLPESLCRFASRVASNFIMELVFQFPKWVLANISFDICLPERFSLCDGFWFFLYIKRTRAAIYHQIS
jgi:hypothetical protein